MENIANVIAAIIVPPIIIGLPVLLIFGKSHIQRWFDLKERRMIMLAEQSGEQAGRTEARITMLEQRIAVLERIATDSSTQLGHEIDRLRNLPTN